MTRLILEARMTQLDLEGSTIIHFVRDKYWVCYVLRYCGYADTLF